LFLLFSCNPLIIRKGYNGNFKISEYSKEDCEIAIIKAPEMNVSDLNIIGEIEINEKYSPFFGPQIAVS
jgi:hypothetical protein